VGHTLVKQTNLHRFYIVYIFFLIVIFFVTNHWPVDMNNMNTCGIAALLVIPEINTGVIGKKPQEM